MPKGSKVDDVYQALRRQGKDEGTAARIAQAQTGQALATGKPPKKAMSFKLALRGLAKANLYEQLGGVFGIAGAVDHFSNALINNPVVGRNSKNPQLRKWHRDSLDRLPGLKFMRTLWVCDVTGGPYEFKGTHTGGKNALDLTAAHRRLKITPSEFDAVAAELGRTLDHVGVPAGVKAKVLEAFAAHKAEVTAGST